MVLFGGFCIFSDMTKYWTEIGGTNSYNHNFCPMDHFISLSPFPVNLLKILWISFHFLAEKKYDKLHLVIKYFLENVYTLTNILKTFSCCQCL
jgi:hypothetical protein